MYSQNIFELKGIRKRVDRLRFIEYDNISIRNGFLTVIFGDSGVGKSTLLNLLALLDVGEPIDSLDKRSSFMRFSPHDNAIPIDYMEIWKRSKGLRLCWGKDLMAEYRLKYFGILPQHCHLIPCLSSLENLNIAGAILRISDRPCNFGKEIMNALKEVGFDSSKDWEDDLRRSPALISGGQQQRLALARACLGSKKQEMKRVIFLDEPTTFMDQGLIENAMNMLIERVANYKQTVIMVTHHKDEIAKYVSGSRVNIQYMRLHNRSGKVLAAIANSTNYLS